MARILLQGVALVQDGLLSTGVEEQNELSACRAHLRRMMVRSGNLISLGVVFLSVGLARAEGLQPQLQERAIRTGSSVSSGRCSDFDGQSRAAPDFATYVDSVRSRVSSCRGYAGGDAWQRSWIGPNGIEAEGGASAGSTQPLGGSAGAESSCNFSLRFRIDGDRSYEYSLAGEAAAWSIGGTSTIWIALVHPNGEVEALDLRAQSPGVCLAIVDREGRLDRQAILTAGDYTLEIRAYAIDGHCFATCSFAVRLDLRTIPSVRAVTWTRVRNVYR